MGSFGRGVIRAFSKRSCLTKSIALAAGAALLLSSCSAQRVQPATVHVDANANQLEHDETVSNEGVTEFYPNKTAPHETVFKGSDGTLFDGTCANADCSTVIVRVRHSPLYPDGTFQLLQTDDPNVLMLRDANGDKTVGYVARDHGGTWKLLPDLQQARDYEHKGDTARKVGKILLGALLVGALIVALSAGAAAEARANTLTTTCTTLGKRTTCTSP